MLWVTPRKIRTLIDTERVLSSIKAAERRTSGEIRVSIAPFFWGSVERAAEKAFLRLGMARTREHNGVLFFVVPSRRAFMVLGDRGIHARVGQAFWDELAAVLSEHFRRGDFTEGLVAAVSKAADQLAAHFPYDPERDRNELDDEIETAPDSQKLSPSSE
jgi:uncharacterized membrane protein